MNVMSRQPVERSSFIKRVGERLKQAKRTLTPGRRAWRGAAWGAFTVLLLIQIVTAIGVFGGSTPLRMLMGAALLVILFMLAGGALTLLWSIFQGVPARYMWVLLSALLVLAYMTMIALSVPLGIVAAGVWMLAVGSLLGAAITAFTGGSWKTGTRVQQMMIAGALGVGTVGLMAGGLWLLDAGTPLTYPPSVPTLTDTDLSPLDMADPSQPGPYAVRRLTYGSGTDRHRAEYGEQVAISTQPVDGSLLVENWSVLRNRYWGFGPGALPLNGRVWYPVGEGPFPLVVMLHGQHPMEEASDPGYAYLGELLASRGFIAVSVDENFLNLSLLADPLIVKALSGENDLRAWLLLEHLRVWRDWNEDPAATFYQTVDMENIALMGHSRGGEAVAIAAAFNDLPCYPDDASLQFGYGFSIRSLIALAPVDGNYQPAGQLIELTDINYLVLHGAHDMDVFTFRGSRQYGRVTFDGSDDTFKSSLYIYGANHGQFNTVWGRKDLFEPIMRVFNLEQLMPPGDQQQVAKVMISAFLEDTLHNQTGYRPLFQDIRRGREWLPDTIYLQQYADASTHMVSTYEEDFDLTSTTLPGGSIAGENLTIWREGPGEAKWETMNSQAVYLGWDAAVEPEQASYTIILPDSGLPLTEDSVLVFEMAAADADSGPLDLTIEVTDQTGEAARLPLSHDALLPPQLEGQVGKAAFMSITPTSEAVLHHFEFRLADFAAWNNAFAPEQLAQVRFIFDSTDEGMIVLDDVGVRN